MHPFELGLSELAKLANEQVDIKVGDLKDPVRTRGSHSARTPTAVCSLFSLCGVSIVRATGAYP